MKHKLFKIWSLVMVMVISISTTGLAINKHYCGGNEKAKSVFFEAEKCPSEVTKMPCKKHEDTQMDRKTCCEDRASFVKLLLNVDLEIENDIVNVTPAIIIAKDQIKDLFSIVQSKREGYVYRPPPLKKDIKILFQTFLL